MAKPIVVVGMHRSGTSLVSRLLDKLGILMGRDLQEDHESKFFIGLNKWIYANAGADWARPEALSELIDFEPAREKVVQYLITRLSSRASKKFSSRALKNGVFDISEPWGWKDPRTGPALPIWLSIWPEMRIVHVMRHGVDVAASLHTRSNRNWDADSDRFDKWLPIYRWRRSQLPIRRGQRAATLENALDFWAEQVSIENSIIGQREEVLRIRFEDILSQPEMQISEIAEFAGSSISPDMLEEMTSSLDPSRAFSHREDRELLEFAEQNAELLANFGY